MYLFIKVQHTLNENNEVQHISSMVEYSTRDEWELAYHQEKAYAINAGIGIDINVMDEKLNSVFSDRRELVIPEPEPEDEIVEE